MTSWSKYGFWGNGLMILYV